MIYQASRVRAGCLAPLSVMLLLPILANDAARAEGSPGPAQCWSPEQLRARKGEEAIRKLVPEAHHSVPDRVLAPVRSLPPGRQKALRRVDLPENSKKLIALTFDLCEQPHEIAGYQGSIVDFLRENNVRATFFVGGKWMLSHRMRTQQLMTDRRFEIGNHTWGHRNLRLLKGKALADEIQNAELAYEDVRGGLASSCPVPGSGRPTSKVPERMTLFRFPFGACNGESLQAVGEAGLIAVQWDVSSGDPTPGVRPEALVRQVVDHVRPGSIVLFHANGRGWGTPAALPVIVAQLRRQGYEFGTVTDLLRLPGAKSVYTDTCFDAKPGDTDRYDAFARRLHVDYDRFTSKYATAAAKPGANASAKQPAAGPEVLPWAVEPRLQRGPSPVTR